MITWAAILSFLSAFLDFFKKHPSWVVIIGLVLYILFLRECTPGPTPCDPCPEILDTITVVQIDSVPYPVEVYIPDIHYKDTGSSHFIFMPVDTNAIIAEYLTKNIIIDTLVNDSNAFIVLTDEIWMNKITNRRKEMTIYPKTVWKTQIVKLTQAYTPVNKVFVGAGIGRSIDQFGLTANIMLLTKREHAYQLSYDVLHNDVYFTMYWKLKFRRRGR